MSWGLGLLPDPCCLLRVLLEPPSLVPASARSTLPNRDTSEQHAYALLISQKPIKLHADDSAEASAQLCVLPLLSCLGHSHPMALPSLLWHVTNFPLLEVQTQPHYSK